MTANEQIQVNNSIKLHLFQFWWMPSIHFNSTIVQRPHIDYFLPGLSFHVNCLWCDNIYSNDSGGWSDKVWSVGSKGNTEWYDALTEAQFGMWVTGLVCVHSFHCSLRCKSEHVTVCLWLIQIIHWL